MSRACLCRSAGTAAAVLTAAALVAACASAPVREVVVVARGMTFALPDATDARNPVLRFRAGERVRLVLKNEAAGLTHDLAIPAWDVALAAVAGGASAEATFTVPAGAVQTNYYCRPHAAMMSGRVEVLP